MQIPPAYNQAAILADRFPPFFIKNIPLFLVLCIMQVSIDMHAK